MTTLHLTTLPGHRLLLIAETPPMLQCLVHRVAQKAVDCLAGRQIRQIRFLYNVYRTEVRKEKYSIQEGWEVSYISYVYEQIYDRILLVQDVHVMSNERSVSRSTTKV